MKRKIIKILLIPLLAGCTAVKAPTKDKNTTNYLESNNVCTSKENCSMPENEIVNGFDEIAMTKALELLRDSQYSGVLYFGFANCPWCVEAVPVLKSVTDAMGVHVNYIKTRDDTGSLLYSEEQKKELYEYIGRYMTKENDGSVTLYVPMVIVVKDGKVVDGHCGTVDGHDAHKRTMNREEKEKLKETYEKILNNVRS